MWELRVCLGRDSRGKVRHLHRRFRSTKRQAERDRARLVTEQDSAPRRSRRDEPQLRMELHLYSSPMVTNVSHAPPSISGPTDVEVYGPKKQGTAYNHAGQRAYRPHPAVWAEAGLASSRRADRRFRTVAA